MTQSDSTSRRLTILTTRGVTATKTYSLSRAKKVKVQGYGRAKTFTAGVIETDREGQWLEKLRTESESFAVLGEPVNWKAGQKKRRLSTDRDGDEATLDDVPRALMPIDVDQIDFEPMADIQDGEMFALELLDRLGLKGVACTWHLTSGHGFFGRYRIRLWVELAEPLTCAQMNELAKARWGDQKVEVDGKQKNLVDFSVYQPQQPIYTADPILKDGIKSPVRTRVGHIEGDPLDLGALPRREAGTDDDQDGNVAKLEDAGLYIKRLKPGQHMVHCLWEEMHSGPSRDDDTFYFEPHFNGHDIPAYKCHHDSCADKKWDAVVQALGLNFSPVGSDESPDPPDAEPLGVIAVRASDVQIEAVGWLWPDRIALGKVTVIAGHPGGGKSQVTCDLAARVTTGSKFPVEGGRAPVGTVLMLSAEDSLADTIAPRLTAAGADLSKVYIVDHVEDAKGKHGFDLIADTKHLDTKLAELRDVRLVVVDPITAYAGVAKMDWNSAGDVRGFLKPLTELAERHKVAVVIVQHLRKDTSAHNAQMAVSGSVGLVAAARAVWTVTKDQDDEDRMLFLAAKSNLAKVSGRGLAYGIESATVEGADGSEVATSRVRWERSLVDKTADEALRESNGDTGSRRTRTQAVEWLRDLLADAPMPPDAVKSAAEKAGHSWATVRRAKDSLGIVPRKKGLTDGWEWRLPE